MTQALTWRYLGPEHVHKCLGANGPEALYAAIREADEGKKDGSEFKLLRTMYVPTPAKVSATTTTAGNSEAPDAAASPSSSSSSPQRDSAHSTLYIQPFESSQRQVVLDLFFHLILKCREFQMTPEKTSAIVGIVAKMHAESMAKVLSLQASYTVFGQLLQLHAVHRPPFSAAVLTIEDAKILTDFVLGTYYRHYKLYLYVFTPRRVATVKGFMLGEGAHDVPPPLPTQGLAIPLAKYEAAKMEAATAEQAQINATLRERRAKEEAERQRVLEEQARIPPIPSGLQQQLSSIRSNVVGLSVNKLDALEAKLERIEQRIAESQQSAANNNQQSTQGPSGGTRKGATMNGSPKRR